MKLPGQFDDANQSLREKIVRVAIGTALTVVTLLAADAFLRQEEIKFMRISDQQYHFDRLMKGRFGNLLVYVDWEGKIVTLRIRDRAVAEKFFKFPRPDTICVRRRTGGLVPWERYAGLDDSKCS
jgi:hypothetical protein